MENDFKLAKNVLQKEECATGDVKLDIDDTRTKLKTECLENKEAGSERICVSLGKIDMHARSGRKLSILAHKLKRLSHEGHMDKFNEIVIAINDRYVMRKLKLGMCVRSQMEVSDIRFTALDAQIEARRLKYDTSLTGSNAFVQMEKLIVFTSNPTASSMTYLARCVSYVFNDCLLVCSLRF